MSSVKGLSWGSCLRTELLTYCPSSLTDAAWQYKKRRGASSKSLPQLTRAAHGGCGLLPSAALQVWGWLPPLLQGMHQHW